MPDEVRRKLRRDDGIDPFTVGFGEIDEAPGRRLCDQLLLRIPLERERHAIGAVAVPPQLVDEVSDEQFGAAGDERDLRFADNHCRHGDRASAHVA